MNDLRRILTFTARLLNSASFLLFSLITCAQEPLKVIKISGGITFDGIPDEEVWKQVPALKMTMHIPVFGGEPTESSVIKILYDNDYLYISGILNYKDPASMRAVGKKRDNAVPSSDWFGGIFDTFNDRENAVSFWTNPNGLRADATIKNDLADPNSDISFSWNTFWDVKTVINNKGWSAEFRIPFSSLRFQVQDGETYMGMTLMRYIASKSEALTFPAIPPDFNAAFWKPSLTIPIVFTGLKPEKPVYVAPYITSGLSQVHELDESATAYKLKSTPKFDAGLDAKYSLTNNLTMDLTVNTDFAQVEADDQKINLTRFSLFFPEKRTFFLEKSDVFDFSFLGGNNLFYSRRIGIYDGHPVRIYGGLRMTGRVNKWDLGILDIQTAPFEVNPGENFGVFRTKRTVLNPNSFVGGILTSRLGMNGAYNFAYGVDGQFRVKGDDYLTVRMAQTAENDSVFRIFNLAPSRLLFQWERRNQKGFSYDFLCTYSGERYNPGIGFEMIEDYKGFRTILRYGWFPAKENVIRYQRISFMGYSLSNTITGLQETAYGDLTWYFEAKNGSFGNVMAIWNHEDLTDTLTLGNDQAFVPPGRYSFGSISALYNTSLEHAFSASFLANAGSFYDGWKVSVSANPRLNIGAGCDLGLTYELDYVKFPGRTISFTNHIAGIRGLLTLSTKTSLTTFIQYNTAIDKIVTNLWFRFNPHEGNDFYVVYDEGLNTNILREVPTLPHSSGRTILLKYTYTFRF
ncbi:MAG: hypothetical protein EPN88_15690 [Bacteroidetes bacterium]|nr:MAG: hypothetical protein EPN88_15690 [Bacteroidota bacterium]